jgi:hypothetical protein
MDFIERAVEEVDVAVLNGVEQGLRFNFRGNQGGAGGFLPHGAGMGGDFLRRHLQYYVLHKADKGLNGVVIAPVGDGEGVTQLGKMVQAVLYYNVGFRVPIQQEDDLRRVYLAYLVQLGHKQYLRYRYENHVVLR